jgi:hypothetical protein
MPRFASGGVIDSVHRLFFFFFCGNSRDVGRDYARGSGGFFSFLNGVIVCWREERKGE